MADACEAKKATTDWRPLNIAIVDSGADLILFRRQNGAFLGSVDIAMGDGGADVPAGERHHLDVQLAENYNKDLKEGEKLSIDR